MTPFSASPLTTFIFSDGAQNMFALNLSSLLTVALFILSSAHSSYSYTWGFPYGSQKVRGVNLGGWLVLEVGFQIIQRVQTRVSVPQLTTYPALDHPFAIRQDRRLPNHRRVDLRPVPRQGQGCGRPENALGYVDHGNRLSRYRRCWVSSWNHCSASGGTSEVLAKRS